MANRDVERHQYPGRTGAPGLCEPERRFCFQFRVGWGEGPGQRPGGVGQQRLDVSPGGQWHLVWTSSGVATGPGQCPSPVLGTAAATPQILGSVLRPSRQEGQ